jgi:hypothetical protein
VLSEIVDHVVWGALKYVEIANAGDTDASLAGLSLAAWTNGALESSTVALPDQVLAPGEAFVIVSDQAEAEYEFVTGLLPDFLSDVADGNGDDAVALIDGDGVILDVFGVPGVDGTGEPWEYTDAAAVRAPVGSCARAVWQAEDWQIVQGAMASSPGILNPEPTTPVFTIEAVQRELVPAGSEGMLEGVIVVGATDDGAFVQERGGPEYAGVFLWLGPGWEALWGPLVPGDVLDVTGLASEWEDQTEIDLPGAWHAALVVVDWAPPALPDAVLLPDLLADPEPWEGTYLGIAGLEVTAETDADGVFEVGDGVATIHVGDAIWGPAAPPTLGTSYELVAGPLSWQEGRWVILPTGPGDLVAD